MGNCCHSKVKTDFEEPLEIPKITQPSILSKWETVAMIKQITKSLCLTSSIMDELSQLILDLFQSLRRLDSQASKQKIEEIFKEQIIARINPSSFPKQGQDRVNYNTLLKTYKNYFQKEKLTQEEKSRIFHTFGKYVKAIGYIDGLFHHEQLFKNQSNPTDEQIDQIVRLECIQDIVEKAAEKFKYRLTELHNESEQIRNMLKNSIDKYQQHFDRIHFDLQDDKEWKQAAQISRYSCEFHEKGIYFLILYLLRSIENSHHKGKTMQEIEKLVNEKILKYLGEKYRPGQRLTNLNEYKEHFQNLNFQKETHGPTYKLSDKNRLDEVKKIIIENAEIGQNLKQKFDKLIAQCCLKESLWFKTGLKLNPQRPNTKSLVRIQEKMFLRNIQMQHKMNGSLYEVLEKQDQVYQETLEKILEEKSQVEFTITDMLRGKCIFLSIEDILSTIHEIKNYINREDSQMQLVEVQNRFLLQNPISDITLKILIKKQLVAQLQLTLQSNFAVYNFAHKIYEFCRSKMFSKIKTIHNYFKEYEKQMTESIVSLLETNEIFSLEMKEKICNFFRVKTKKNSFSLDRSLHQNIIKNQISPLEEESFLEKMKSIQPIIDLIFHRKLNIVTQQMMDNNTLTEEVQPLKAMIMLQKMKIQDPFTAQQNPLGFNNVKCDQNLLKQSCKWSFRNQLRYQQISSYDSDPSKIEAIFKQIYGNSVETAEMYLKFSKRNQLKQVLESAQKDLQKAYSCLENQLNIQHQVFREIVHLKYLEFSFQIARIPLTALSQLQQIESFMKQKHNAYYTLIAELLIAQYFLLYEQEQPKFREHYNKAKQMSKIQGIPLSGQSIYECQFRIQDFLCKSSKSEEEVQYILDNNLRKLFYEFGAFKRFDAIYQKGFSYWKLYKILGLKQQQFKPNTLTTDLYLLPQIGINMDEEKWQFLFKIQQRALNYIFIKQYCDEQLCQKISMSRWPNLAHLELSGNGIDEKGCFYLAKGNWPKLSRLRLQANNIGQKGCEFIAQGSWINISELNVSNNKIGDKGCFHLSQGKWPNLKALALLHNEIGNEGCGHLIQGQWPKLSQIYLTQNLIGSHGCYYLSQSNWSKLDRVHLDKNKIDDLGCAYLAKSSLPIMQLYLDNNQIGDGGCQFLSKAPWNNLAVLYLSENQIGDAGCEHLSRSDRPKLTQFNLRSNQIGEEGCKHLSHGIWPKLINLTLSNNKFSQISQNKEYITQILKKSFPTTNLYL